MWRLRKQWILSSFVLLAIVSLLSSQWGAWNKPIANFFLLPFRAWELAIGAIIAFYFLRRKGTRGDLAIGKGVQEAAGVIGLILIGYSVLMFNEGTPFPSFYALVPTIGTGLIILFATKKP